MLLCPFTGNGKLADGSTENHQEEQDDGKPTFHAAQVVLLLRTRGIYHQKERGIAPVLHEIVVAENDKAVTFLVALLPQVVDDIALTATVQLQYRSTVLLLEVEIADFPPDGGESGSEHKVYPVIPSATFGTE